MTRERPRVLVVEDDLGARTTLLRVLGTDYEVSVSVDGEAALWRFYAGERFDVVLCDVCMPRMDGAAFVDHLRRVDVEQASRVIVLTGNASSPQAARLSGHYMIDKPYNVRELRELVARVAVAVRSGYFPTIPPTRRM